MTVNMNLCVAHATGTSVAQPQTADPMRLINITRAWRTAPRGA